MWDDLHVARLDLSSRFRGMVAYAIGMAAYTLAVVALYPSFRHSSALQGLERHAKGVMALFGASGSLTSPDGWLVANVYGNFLPLIVLVVGIGYGAACVAGQDEQGTLGLVATLPLARRRLVAGKALALVVQDLVVAAATLGVVYAGRGFELRLPVWDAATATLGAALLGIAFGLVALATGSWTGRRPQALAVASAAAAASYLLNALSPEVSWLHPARYASLFYWSVGDHQLTQGLTGAQAGVLLGVALAAFGLAVVGFRRLDVH